MFQQTETDSEFLAINNDPMTSCELSKTESSIARITTINFDDGIRNIARKAQKAPLFK